MHAEEGQLGVGDGIDEPADEVLALGPERVVLPPEGEDLEVQRDAHQPRDAVGVEPGAVDQVAGPAVATVGLDGQTARPLVDASHLGLELEGAAGLPEESRVDLCDLGEVDDRRGR